MSSSVLLAAVLAVQGPRPSSDTTTIVIAATSDVHGRATAWNYEQDSAAPLGLTRVATVVDSLRRAHPGRVIVVDAGDLLQGNSLAWVASREPRRGVNPMIRAMNLIRYDVVTSGNHEFNYPLPLLDSLLRGRRFGYVSANILRLPGRTPRYRTDTTLVRGGVRIGVTGATTPGVLVWDGPHVAGRLTFSPIPDAVPPVVRRMRARGADVTVLLAHAGLEGPSSYAEGTAPPENTVAEAIRASGDIDVAVIGHTHREIADSTVGSALVLQPKNWAQSVAVAELTLARTAGRWRIVSKRGTIVPLANVTPDSAVVRQLAGWHDMARERMNQPLGVSADAMPATRARIEDSPVTDFVATVMRERSGAQLAATAVFDVQAGLPRGNVSRRDIMALYPYDNTLVAVRISGAALRAYLEQTSRYYRGMGPDGPIVNDSIPGYSFDLVSGVDYEYDLSQPMGTRLAPLRYQGRDVRNGDAFTIALNNYRAQGGGGFAMLAGAPQVYTSDQLIRTMLGDELARRRSVAAADVFVANWHIRGVTASTMAGTDRFNTRVPILLRVFATNDLHGALEPRVAPWSNRRPVGGMAALSGMMRRLSAECACPTVRLDGGDVMQGSAASNLTHGRAMVDAFVAMGMNAGAIGNHEFDWTVDTLAARIAGAAPYAWVSANIRELATRQRPPWARPWTMVSAGALRVAVVGYTTPGTSTSTNPLHVSRLGFSGAPSVDSAIAEARAQRPDYVIVVAHEGAFCNPENECQGSIVTLAQALRNRPDLIVSGHTHSLVTTTVNGIPIVQARSSGAALGVVDFVRADSGRAVQMRVETVWADRETPDSAVAAVVARHAEAVRPLVQRVVAELGQDLPRADTGGYPLADMVADALRDAAGADVALVNLSGIRTQLWAGPVTWGQLYEVLPFGNYVVQLPVTGAVLRRALEHGLGGSEVRAAVSGVRVTRDRRAPAGQRLTILTLADGRTIADDATYQLATFDFLAVGGSGYSMLRDVPFTNTGVAELEAFVTWLQRQPQPVRVAQPYAARISDR